MSPRPQRALLVSDVQHEYIVGSLPVEYPAPSTSLPNIGRAMDAARQAGIPVVVVSHESSPGSPVFGRGSAGTKLHQIVSSRPHDLHITKSLPSVLSDTPLGAWITERGIAAPSLLPISRLDLMEA